MAKGFSPFGGKESKKEESKEKKMPPWMYKKGEKSEGEKPKKFAKGGGVELRGKTRGKVV
jgi:hypothetical protein